MDCDLSTFDFRDDVLILAGDVSDSLESLGWCLNALAKRFAKVLFVPGNHELWVARDRSSKTSSQKFKEVGAVVEASGASAHPCRIAGVFIVPLLGWYDYSFGTPSAELKSIWMDYHACRWPVGTEAPEIAAHFASLNADADPQPGDKVITFSHFVPRIDVMPKNMPKAAAALYPVLGTSRLERQLRRLNPAIHVYGHSHINRNVTIDGVAYINNAFGYPHEASIAKKRLLCIHDG